ncbi:MAG: hypothetical protein CMI54_02300 [Parcubacteria group bacterium]|nr:hypothetical protein [Parcubacteria group bacterium]|tara:strand:+ start:3662 stop:3844 length:183 start_codon:yes stop_codon:yes gene_type:complete
MINHIMKYTVELIAIAGLVMITITALNKGINGAVLMTSLAAIGAIAGYNFKNKTGNSNGK